MPKDAFFQIHPEKRDRVIQSAIALFADRGFHRTDVAEIAVRAKIGKGSIYNYFKSKEELYLHVCRYALEQSRKAVYSGIQAEWDVYRQIRHIFENGMAFVQSNPDYLRLYLNFSSAGLDEFAELLSSEVEAFTADYLKELLRRGMEAGIVRGELDVDMAAFLVNSLYIMFMVSQVSGHFHLRLKTYLDLTEDPFPEQARDIMARILDMIERMLRPAGNLQVMG